MKTGDTVWVTDIVLADIPRQVEVLHAGDSYVVVKWTGIGSFEDCIDLRREDRIVAPTLKEFFAKRAEAYHRDWKNHQKLMEQAIERHGILLTLADKDEEALQEGLHE